MPEKRQDGNSNNELERTNVRSVDSRQSFGCWRQEQIPHDPTQVPQAMAWGTWVRLSANTNTNSIWGHTTALIHQPRKYDKRVRKAQQMGGCKADTMWTKGHEEGEWGVGRVVGSGGGGGWQC